MARFVEERIIVHDVVDAREWIPPTQATELSAFSRAHKSIGSPKECPSKISGSGNHPRGFPFPFRSAWLWLGGDGRMRKEVVPTGRKQDQNIKSKRSK